MTVLTRTLRLPVLGLVVLLILTQALGGHGRGAASPSAPHADDGKGPGRLQERYLYVATIAQSASDPDFVTVVGADPRRRDFGRIVRRVDMPNIGDELHHFGYSSDQKRLVVPGLFSNRLHVFDVRAGGRDLRLRAVNEDLVGASGYIIPHSVLAPSPGHMLVTMIGAATGTEPGGIVAIDDKTGAFQGHFGPGPARDPGVLGPRYMYDFDALPEVNRGISTTFEPPALCGGGIAPACLGDAVAVWDLEAQKVIQAASLGAFSGALEVRFIEEHDVRRAFINTPGTSAIWLADDDDHDGVFEFRQVLGAGDGLALPVDMLLSYDHRYLYVTTWFGNTVQQFDISPRAGHPRRGGLGQLRGHVRKKTTIGPAGPHMMLFDPSIPVGPGEH